MSFIVRGNMRMALAGVRGAKWRSFLTMLGVIIGIVSVVTVVGIGEGMKRQVTGAIDHFGDDLITIRPGQVDSSVRPTPANTDVVFGMRQAGGFTVQDVQAVQQARLIDVAAPLGVVPGIVQAADQQLHGGVVLATNADLPAAINQEVSFGEFWDSGGETANFAVLGRKAALNLFEESVPLGKSFEFRGESFIVRGVLSEFKEVPLSPTAEFNNAVFIPYQTAARLSDNRAETYAILAKPDSPERMDSAIHVITEELRDVRGGEQDFSVLSPQDQVAASSNVLDLLTTWIMAVAAISLLIGGVGIMNIMLVSVTERMHEIGVRKAVGATNRQIMWQFTLEATVLSVVGGIIGIALSLLAHIALLAYTDLQPVLSWQAIVVATLVSLAIGIIFGTAPAIKAARKDPIEALRHE